MIMDVTRDKIRIIPESELDKAYIDDTLGAKDKTVQLRKVSDDNNEFFLETVPGKRSVRTRVRDSSEKLPIGEQIEGQIKSYNDSRAFGFIKTSLSNDDVFFHITNIHGGKKPAKGDTVMFRLLNSESGLKGEDIVIIRQSIK